MQLIDRDKIEIPRKRDRLIDGLIYVPLADVQKALDGARVVFDEKDVATLSEALDRQVRKLPRWEELEKAGELGSMRTDVRPFCPTCGTELKNGKHCHECGQALNWEVGR